MSNVWRRRSPNRRASLADALPFIQTENCRALARLYAELLEKASPGSVPEKQDFDVTRLPPSTIPNLALAAFTTPDRCIWRLVGDKVQKRMGFNPTGEDYATMIAPERKGTALGAMEMAVRRPCGYRAVTEQFNVHGIKRTIELLCLPLRSREDGIDSFLLFVDDEVPAPRALAPDRSGRMGDNVVERDLIDLGFGVDETFEDIVRAG